jgi:hypothetical protein
MNMSTRSFKLKIIILVAATLVFVPVTYLWHSALSGYHCEAKESDIVSTNTMDSKCTYQTSFHWIAFYSINGIIYGIPFLTLVLKRHSE